MAPKTPVEWFEHLQGDGDGGGGWVFIAILIIVVIVGAAVLCG